MADIKIAGRIKAGAADNIAGYASEILFDDQASNKTVKEKIEEVASSPQTMIVTISSDGNYTADKTFAEIKAFIDNGGTVIAKDEEDGDSYYYLDNYIASEVVFCRNIWGSNGFTTRSYTIDNTNTVTFDDSLHFISSDVNSGSTANLANSAAVKTVNDKVATKQDTISDLSTIRSGAAAGATAVQPAALQEGLAGKQDTISDLATIRSGAEDGATAVQPDEMTAALAGKQNVIEDLSTIRSGAAAGATAVQPAAMNTALAAKQDTLTFDNTPTANSDNPVKSSGIKTALDAKQSTISTVDVTVDNNTGTPSASASVSGSTLSLSFQNLKGATGATGATGPQGPQGERGLPGESGVTGDVSGFTVIQTIDPSATYGATDIAGAATVQATNAELTELAGELYGSAWVDVTGWVTGKYIATNQGVGATCPMSETTLSQMNYVKIAATAGETYHLIGVGGKTPRLWAMVDSTRSKIIAAAAGNTDTLEVPEDVTLTIAQDCWLIVNVYNSSMTPPYKNNAYTPYSLKKEVISESSRIDSLEDSISAIDELEDVVGNPDNPYYDLSSGITWIDGYSIDSSTGGMTTDKNFSVFSPFDISGYSAVKLSMMTVASDTIRGLAWYDSSQAYISGQACYNTGTAGYEEHTYMVPSNAKYLRVTTRKSDKANFSFIGMKNDIATRLIFAETSISTLEANDRTINVSWSGNGAIVSSTGVVASASDRKYSDYIDISDYDYLYISNIITNSITHAGLAFYDSNKTYISGEPCTFGYENGVDIRKYAVPSTAQYIRVTFWNTDTYGTFKIYEARETENKYKLPDVSVYATNDYSDYGLEQGTFTYGSFVNSTTRVHLPLISVPTHISVKDSYYILFTGRIVNGSYNRSYDSIDTYKYRRSLYLPKIDNVAFCVVIARKDEEAILPTDDIIEDMSYLDYEDKLANISSNDSNKLSLLMLSDEETVVGTAMNYILKDEYENSVRYLRLSEDCGKTWTSIENIFGDIVFVHWFSNGDLLFATPSKCYYSNDGLTTVNESQLYDLDGTTFVAEATEHFFQNDQSRNPIMMVGNTELVAWGDYYFNEAAYKGRAWYSDDYGHSVRCFFKSGESVIGGNTISVRHTHGVLYDKYTEKFYLITGDSSSECCLIECVYSQGSWNLTLLGRGANYKFGDIRFDKFFMYFVTDYTDTSLTSRGILRCPKNGLSDFSNYKFIAKAPSSYTGSVLSFIEDRNGNKLMFPDYNGSGQILYCRNTLDFETVSVSGNCVLTNVTDPNYNGDVYCRKSLSTTPFKLSPMINLTKSMRNSGVKDFFDQNNIINVSSNEL